MKFLNNLIVSPKPLKKVLLQFKSPNRTKLTGLLKELPKISEKLLKGKDMDPLDIVPENFSSKYNI